MSLTSVVDEDVELRVFSLDVLESMRDRLVTGELKLNCFHSIVRLGNFLAEACDGRLGFFQSSTTKQDSVQLVGLQECLDGFIADTAVASCNENNH